MNNEILEGYILLDNNKVLHHYNGRVVIIKIDDPGTIIEESTIETWTKLSETNVVRRLVSIYDNGEYYKTIRSLSLCYNNVQEHSKYAGMGEDDIGAGVKWATYVKYFYFPIAISRKVILNVYNKFNLPIEEYTRSFIHYDEVKVHKTGYGLYNHPVWVTVTEIDNLGNECNPAYGHVFGGTTGYRIDDKYFQLISLDYEYFLERTVFRHLCKTDEDYKIYEEESEKGRNIVKNFKKEMNQLLIDNGVIPTVLFETTGWEMITDDDVTFKQNVCNIFEGLDFKPSNYYYEKGVKELYNHLKQL